MNTDPAPITAENATFAIVTGSPTNVTFEILAALIDLLQAGKLVTTLSADGVLRFGTVQSGGD